MNASHNDLIARFARFPIPRLPYRDRSPTKMRTNVTFRHPAEFVGDENGAGVLAVHGAKWFAEILSRVPHLELDADPCQEDWGVVFFARRNQKKFWIGLSAWNSDRAWLAHFYHGTFAWLQRFSSRGNEELELLIADIHKALVSESVTRAANRDVAV